MISYMILDNMRISYMIYDIPGWCPPRMVSIVEAERIRSERVLESRIRAGETRNRHSEQAGSGAAGGSVE